MRPIVVDTSAIYAIVDRNDLNHARAACYFRQQAGEVHWILSNHIFDESMTLIKARLGSRIAIQTGLRLRNSKLVDLVVLSVAEEQAVWRLFVQYQDKAWSYTDCVCLMMARKWKTNEAFSFDHHFTQMSLHMQPE